ncbi:MAG: hypothetical protein R3E79_00395 [Caldilineaceae bacterium]
MKNAKLKATYKPNLPHRPPMLRSANWALLLGGVAGALVGVGQVHALHGGWGWRVAGGMVGILLGMVAGGDLLLPGPPKRPLTRRQGDRIGPLRWSVLLLLVTLEGLIIGGYLWGTVTLTCERVATEQDQPAQVDCHRTVTGWFNSRQTSETLYEHVTGVALSVHDELLLQHGPYAQSQSVAGFGPAAMPQVAQFLATPGPVLSLRASDWRVRLGAPICLLLACLAGVWAWLSLRRGLHTLYEQFALGEVFWGWRREQP